MLAEPAGAASATADELPEPLAQEHARLQEKWKADDLARAIKAADAYEAKNAAALGDALFRLGVHLRYNVRAARTELEWPHESGWQEMTDIRAAWLREQVADHFTYQTQRGTSPLRFGPQAWHDYINALLFTQQVDPVVEWLEDLPDWDGEPRACELLRVAFEIDREKTPKAIEHWASRYLTLGAICRTYRPGVKQDEMPVIVGPQGCGKSTLLQWLLPDAHRSAWFNDGLNLADNPRERAEALQGRLIVEVGEMAGSTRAELESLKAFLSRTEDRQRLAYRRDPETLPRRCIIVGTANGSPLPNDPTGNRRFVAVHITGGNVKRTRDYLEKNRGQVWAEALRLYHSGDEAWLPSKLAAVQATGNEYARRRDDMIEDAIDEWLSGQNGHGFTLAEAIAGAGVNPRDERRVGAALRQRGYEKRRERRGGGAHPMVWRLPA